MQILLGPVALLKEGNQRQRASFESEGEGYGNPMDSSYVLGLRYYGSEIMKNNVRSTRSMEFLVDFDLSSILI